jgi:hypothetical protein
VKELICESGLTPSEIIREVKDHISDRKPVYCDAAEPKSIEELYRGGINAQAANKEVCARRTEGEILPFVTLPADGTEPD